MRTLLRAILIDDVEYARKNLRCLLNDLAVEVVAETGCPRRALELVAENKPHLAFLDIELANDKNGITLAEEITRINPSIFIVYATAFLDYTVDALNAKAVAMGYIMKPFHKAELQHVLTKIKELIKANRIEFRTKEGRQYIPPDDIILIEKEKKYTIIHTKERSLMSSESLASIESRIASSPFLVRAHKSYIINLNKIKNRTNYSETSYRVEFVDCPKDALMLKNIEPSNY